MVKSSTLESIIDVTSSLNLNLKHREKGKDHKEDDFLRIVSLHKVSL